MEQKQKQFNFDKAVSFISPYSPDKIGLLCMEARASLFDLIQHLDKDHVFFDVEGATIWEAVERIGATLSACERFFALVQDETEESKKSEESEEHEHGTVYV